jgi:ankyrin repeat protein
MIKTILEHGGNPIIKDDQGRTALHIAIQVKNEEILHYPYKHDQRNNSEEKIKYIEKIFQVFEWIFNQSNNVEQISSLCVYVTYVNTNPSILFQLRFFFLVN